jgi:hypothetical protein
MRIFSILKKKKKKKKKKREKKMDREAVEYGTSGFYTSGCLE